MNINVFLIEIKEDDLIKCVASGQSILAMWFPLFNTYLIPGMKCYQNCSAM